MDADCLQQLQQPCSACLWQCIAVACRIFTPIQHIRQYITTCIKCTLTQTRVPTLPGKSWIFCKISRRWKVLENGFGPGKSWNFLGYDVGGGHSDAGANLWLSLDMQNRKGIQLRGALPPDPHCAVFGQFVCYFSVTVINVYRSIDAAISVMCIYIWLVTAICLYI